MKLGAFLNPYFQLLLTALLGTAAEVCLKFGATQTANPAEFSLFGLSGLASKWVWLGIVFTVLSFLSWMQALRTVPLAVAFTLSNVVHVLVPLSCWYFLGESLGPRRLLGIGLVVAGLLVVAKPFAKLDERLG
jgi:multidrug transporter EmrE-like cation transporter